MSENQELALIGEQEMSQLSQLPDILSKNRGLRGRAIAAVEPVLKEFSEKSLTEMPDLEIQQWDEKLNELSGKLKDSVKVNNDRRKPYTSTFDRIKSLFTAEEKAISDVDEKVVAERKRIALEVHSRQEKERKRKEDELAKKDDDIAVRAVITQRMGIAFREYRDSTIKRMSDKFYSMGESELPAYVDTLRNYEPVLKVGAVTCEGPNPTKYNSKEEIIGHTVDVIREMYPGLQAQFTKEVTAKRDELIDLKDSRLRELKEIAEGNAKAAEEAKQRRKDEEAAAEKRRQEEAEAEEIAIKAAAEGEKLNAAFETEVKSNTVATQGKGTKIAKEYSVESPAGWKSIIMWYVANEFPRMTPAEMEKKLGFMLTAANKALAEGELIESQGLKLIDAVKTRTSRK